MWKCSKMLDTVLNWQHMHYRALSASCVGLRFMASFTRPTTVKLVLFTYYLLIDHVCPQHVKSMRLLGVIELSTSTNIIKILDTLRTVVNWMHMYLINTISVRGRAVISYRNQCVIPMLLMILILTGEEGRENKFEFVDLHTYDQPTWMEIHNKHAYEQAQFHIWNKYIWHKNFRHLGDA